VNEEHKDMDWNCNMNASESSGRRIYNGDRLSMVWPTLGSRTAELRWR